MAGFYFEIFFGNFAKLDVYLHTIDKGIFLTVESEHIDFMSRKDEFVGFFIKYQQHLFNFILTLVPNYSDAEDILQKSAAIMWDKFDTFDRNTAFLAWARKVIRYNISNYYKTKKKEFRLDDDLLETLCLAQERSSEHFEDQRAALRICMGKLGREDRDLLQLRYYQGVTVQDIARKINKPASILYRRISAICVLLQRCITRTLRYKEGV